MTTNQQKKDELHKQCAEWRKDFMVHFDEVVAALEDPREVDDLSVVSKLIHERNGILSNMTGVTCRKTPKN